MPCLTLFRRAGLSQLRNSRQSLRTLSRGIFAAHHFHYYKSFTSQIYRLQLLEHWTKDPNLLEEANVSIQHLISQRDVLMSHLHMIPKAVDTLQVALQHFSFGKGVDSLPNEVLSKIFETYKGLGEEICNLSLVSRRFRRIVRETPKLWNSISNCGYTMSRIAKYLERSKETGMHVNLCLHESKDPFKIYSKLVVAGALNSALCHAKGLKTLHITIEEEWSHDDESMLKMREHLLE